MDKNSYRLANYNDGKSQDRSIAEIHLEIQIVLQIIIQIERSEVRNLARNAGSSETR